MPHEPMSPGTSGAAAVLNQGHGAGERRGGKEVPLPGRGPLSVTSLWGRGLQWPQCSPVALLSPGSVLGRGGGSWWVLRALFHPCRSWHHPATSLCVSRRDLQCQGASSHLPCPAEEGALPAAWAWPCAANPALDAAGDEAASEEKGLNNGGRARRCCHDPSSHGAGLWL